MCRIRVGRYDFIISPTEENPFTENYIPIYPHFPYDFDLDQLGYHAMMNPFERAKEQEKHIRRMRLRNQLASARQLLKDNEEIAKQDALKQMLKDRERAREQEKRLKEEMELLELLKRKRGGISDEDFKAVQEGKLTKEDLLTPRSEPEQVDIGKKKTTSKKKKKKKVQQAPSKGQRRRSSILEEEVNTNEEKEAEVTYDEESKNEIRREIEAAKRLLEQYPQDPFDFIELDLSILPKPKKIGHFRRFIKRTTKMALLRRMKRFHRGVGWVGEKIGGETKYLGRKLVRLGKLLKMENERYEQKREIALKKTVSDDEARMQNLGVEETDEERALRLEGEKQKEEDEDLKVTFQSSHNCNCPSQMITCSFGKK